MLHCLFWCKLSNVSEALPVSIIALVMEAVVSTLKCWSVSAELRSALSYNTVIFKIFFAHANALLRVFFTIILLFKFSQASYSRISHTYRISGMGPGQQISTARLGTVPWVTWTDLRCLASTVWQQRNTWTTSSPTVWAILLRCAISPLSTGASSRQWTVSIRMWLVWSSADNCACKRLTSAVTPSILETQV
jgi:hypothetical protein